MEKKIYLAIIFVFGLFAFINLLFNGIFSIMFYAIGMSVTSIYIMVLNGNVITLLSIFLFIILINDLIRSRNKEKKEETDEEK